MHHFFTNASSYRLFFFVVHVKRSAYVMELHCYLVCVCVCAHNCVCIVVQASVPGSVFTDLMRAGVIEDPYFRFNDVTYRRYCYLDWNYQKSFIGWLPCYWYFYLALFLVQVNGMKICQNLIYRRLWVTENSLYMLMIQQCSSILVVAKTDTSSLPCTTLHTVPFYYHIPYIHTFAYIHAYRWVWLS